MAQKVRITALPDDEAHPDFVVAAIEASVARFDGAKLVACWTDVSADLGDGELAVRVAVGLEGHSAVEALERAVDDDLRRRRLRCTLTVGSLEPDVVLSDAPTLHTIRNDVRRLVDLVPRGRVTTACALGEWMGTDVERVALTLRELAAAARSTAPWHRVTAAGGWLDARRDYGWSRLQTARLESDGVAVRHGRVVGFRTRFIDVVRLGVSDAL